MAKRTATSDLNHDNWDREDEPEEAGSFSKASEEALKKRVIKVAKRRNPISSTQGDEEKPSAFGGFSGFAKAAPPTSNTFGFLSNLANKTEAPKTNGTAEEKLEKSDKNPDEYYAKLKGLNESVTEWIKKHVSANPFINLQPIFKDYDKYIADLEKLKVEADKTGTSTTPSKIPAGVPKFPAVSTFSSLPSPKFSFAATTTAPSTFSFGSTSTTSSAILSGGNSFATTSTFSFGSSNTSASSDGKFSFSSVVVKPATNTDTTTTEEDQDEPPKVEFKPVQEEGHIYTIRCKVFVKKDGNYADHGVGTLYLKPVPNSEKVQLFVRADTNLGNLICNFILSEGIPMQRMGKKDVMLVCLPTPETKPPPVPILLRVKSPEDADELLKMLQTHKK